ncbi:uncharacterized protein KRP23_6430 [Phytophthora ramorum]|uniref:uncharacterized protein n=1 Tax=Phytophthora ramorum TaxID=164328 RepID=UPI0030A34E37|nr:hypothetical protein KRP23_6430 [Phytophthora ramorum]
MPFLRSLDSVSSSQELRSSKTLIGSGATTCDVVIPGDNVLELHALLNLSADKASAKLVPFSTSEAGVCYVNDAVVPREGAIVVHGDRVAFGNPRNVFLFELTPHPQMTALSSQTENSVQHPISANRAFRKALDTLRGDRKTSTPNASVIASIQSNTPAARNRNSVSSFENSDPSPSKSKDQLSKFLLEASTDSLLSDYVERKLKQRKSSSVGASNQSNSTRRSRPTVKGRQSREERNAAEVEKLRLSQRIREVNDVLNGDMKFQESYLSPSAKSSKSNKPQWANDNNHRLGSSNVLQPVEVEGVDDSDEDNEEEDEDDLPTMMERPASTSAGRALPNLSSSIQTEHSEQESSSHPPKCKEVEELQKLMVMIEEKDQELKKLKQQKRAKAFEKTAAKTKWEQILQSVLESAIVKCDEQIAQTSDQLEELLRSAEDDVLAARFGAAQFLVDSILQQKIHNATEWIRLQEVHIAAPSSGKSPASKDPSPDLSDLSSNGRFLYDMIQQRLTRLQQLHESLAKLAAVSDSSNNSLDPERLRHSCFLADALLVRQQLHISSILTLHRRSGV